MKPVMLGVSFERKVAEGRASLARCSTPKGSSLFQRVHRSEQRSGLAKTFYNLRRAPLGFAIRAVVASLWLIVIQLQGTAHAEANYSVQGDALLRAQPGMGLLTLQGDSEIHPWISAEALVWSRYGSDLDGDALVMAIRLRDPSRRAELRLGRFVLTPGALRPVHIDGGHARLRLPADFYLEGFAGIPAVVDFDSRSYDWIAGSRISRSLGDWGSVGVAYAQRRDHGVRADEEVAFDAGATIGDLLDLNGRLSYDLLYPGISEAHGAAVLHDSNWRAELFYTERSPSRILLSTSLFSVLGDSVSRRGGFTGHWRLAPRLDVDGTAALRMVGRNPGESITLRTTLRLDDLGSSSMAIEGRREGVIDGSWTGVRGVARVQVLDTIFASTEVEMVFPDDPHGRGVLWPWGLLAMTWKANENWEVAVASQGSISPDNNGKLDAMLRLTHRSGAAL
ncbi:MAG: hypothetical protein IPJ88_16845 [Myxococcales bacterium]|nr:MAG: hypothetical protein IPJ88_16845 [Myxococcales bacterium]